jgi:sigma-B regulation protein RsbU (phosphoserine phosphatase)
MRNKLNYAVLHGTSAGRVCRALEDSQVEPETLPAVPHAGVHRRLEAALSPKGTRVLAVEDDAVTAKVLCTHLQQFGYEVELARDGEEAWSLFTAAPPRIIVSDWMMPETDGLTLCERVRASTGTPYTYFILLTANRTNPENYALATAAGVDDFLTKPVDRAALQMRLRVAERILRFTAEIRQLKELIPICVYCRKVRDEEDYWEMVETYIQKETGSRFSHGACPECCQKELANLRAASPLDSHLPNER